MGPPVLALVPLPALPPAGVVEGIDPTPRELPLLCPLHTLQDPSRLLRGLSSGHDGIPDVVPDRIIEVRLYAL
jgi:hypothetical protein